LINGESPFGDSRANRESDGVSDAPAFFYQSGGDWVTDTLTSHALRRTTHSPAEPWFHRTGVRWIKKALFVVPPA
jgi:hypothetical protein